MTIREAWANGRDRLAQASFMPELDARLLLQHVLGQEHSYLIAHGDEVLDATQQAAYEALLARAAQKEPIPYLIRRAPFYGLDLTVTPDVLIPRPETEQLVEEAARWARANRARRVIDAGTGSGCIALALAGELPGAEIVATDTSAAALAVAQGNATRLAPGRITFLQGDLLAPAEGRFDLIVANLPYIADSEWSEVDDGVKWYEPALALAGGADGLDLMRILFRQAPAKLRPGGAIFLEIGWQQGRPVENLARSAFPKAEIMVLRDYAGRDRFVRLVV